LTSYERFICERENFVFDSLIYLEPVERFKNRNNVMKFGSFGSRVKDKLKTDTVFKSNLKTHLFSGASISGH